MTFQEHTAHAKSIENPTNPVAAFIVGWAIQIGVCAFILWGVVALVKFFWMHS